MAASEEPNKGHGNLRVLTVKCTPGRVTSETGKIQDATAEQQMRKRHILDVNKIPGQLACVT